MVKRFWSLPVDWFILFIPIILMITGIVTIYTITFPDYQWKLTVDQITFASIGLLIMALLMFTDYRIYSSIPGIVYAFGIILLVPLLPMLAPKLPFVNRVFGASRWLDFGFFQLQPSEVFKLIGTIVASAFLSTRIGNINFRSLTAYTILAGIPLTMVLLQPNLGTTSVLLVIFLTIFFAAKPPRKVVALIIIVGLIAIPLTFFSLKPYQKTRIETFLNPATNTQEEGYNVKQSLIAVGSGGLMGRGFGQGSQTVLNFLPVPHSDFIFAGFSEATGFVGSFVLLGLYFILLMRIISVAGISADPFGQLICIGVAAKFFFQIVVHIGMNLGLLPVTGIPLPFMSYGGTALIIDLASIGLVLNIYIRHKKFVFA